MRILLINQCFYPDVVSTAQHARDLACSLVERGHEVTVIASSRGYDDPSVRFPAEEYWKGIQIFRVPCLATGKGKRWKRTLNILSFFLTTFSRLLTMRSFDVVIALTSPPLISALAAAFVRIKGGRFVFWVMDLNPDEAIAAGWLNENSRTARLLESTLRFSADSADSIVVLDRFMRDRFLAKGVAAAKLAILPPWSHSRDVHYDAKGRKAFRDRHGLTGKYVVMYSGNHSPCHPLDTVLDAARRLADDPGVIFCFIGGGSEYPKVRAFAERHELNNVLCLPYQPLEELSASLSAADLHVVVMGEPFAGLVHPCKIYNVMEIGIPVLYIGPDPSHITDIGFANPGLPIIRCKHGDIAGVVETIEAGILATASDIGMKRAAQIFSADRILSYFRDLIETSRLPLEQFEEPVAIAARAASGSR
jgi:glycosyltransferase involved in cell wall biosynthesis